MESASAMSQQRFDELDSLRGIAATMVVLNHFFLATKSTGNYEDILRTIADPFQNGPAAVTLFFLLSGFVLSLTVWRGKPSSYSVFIVRRICRIYVPYLFGLALSVLGASIFASRTVPGLSQWFYATWTGPVNWTLVFKHILFIGPSYNVREFNTAFWTLIIEMRVSIILPFFLLLMRRLSFSGMWLTCAITLFLGFVSGQSVIRGISALQIFGWTGLFIAGAIVARVAIVEPTRISHTFSKPLVAVLSLSAFLFATCLGRSLHLSDLVTRSLCAIGGLGTICVALYNCAFRDFLNTQVLHFMGRVSYSLYLLHATVLYVTLHLFSQTLSKMTIFVIYIGVSFLVAAISHSIIERPSIELGRRLTKGRRTVTNERNTLVHVS